MLRSSVLLSRAAVLSIGIAVLATSIASAQSTAPTDTAGPSASVGIPAFARQLAGKNVWITADGARVRGQVSSVSPTGLVLVEDGKPTTIAYSKIVRVEKSSHRLRNGAWIGFAAGAGSAAVVGIALCAEDDCAGWEPILFSGFYGGLGAAAGAGIGAIINAAKRNGDVIYDARRKTTTISLAPILSPTRKGLAFSMTWR